MTVVEDAPAATEAYAERAAAVRRLGAGLSEVPAAAVIEKEVGACRRRRAEVRSFASTIRHLLRPATWRGQIRSEIDLAGERAAAPIVAVTGTNGKTTVTTLTAAMLTASGRLGPETSAGR